MVKPDFQAVDGAGIKHIHRRIGGGGYLFRLQSGTAGRDPSSACSAPSVGNRNYGMRTPA